MDIIDNQKKMQESVKNRKDAMLNMRFESTIARCGLSKQEFYDKIEVSRAYWWRITWGIDPVPSWLKIKLCDTFGKPFIDFFLMYESEVKKNEQI